MTQLTTSAPRAKSTFAAVRRRCSASSEPSWWSPWWCPCCSFSMSEAGNVKSAAVQPNYGQQAPCPIKEADGSKAKYVENRNITLRVLNGTKFSGFAKAVSDALQNREFNPQTPDNYTKKVDRTMIVFGKNGVNQAYTVASNFTDACWLWTTVRTS